MLSGYSKRLPGKVYGNLFSDDSSALKVVGTIKLFPPSLTCVFNPTRFSASK